MSLLSALARRGRRTDPTLADDDLRATWQLVSVLLGYPTAETIASVPMLRSVAVALPEQVGMPLVRLLDHLAESDLAELQARYVDTFDVTRRCCLYLTYFAHGDTRSRGVALVQVKQAYRKAGVELAEDELPDHLSVVLEFGATVDRDGAWKLLNEHRAGIEMLRIALQDRDSEWVYAVEALCATLPAIDGDDREAVARLIEQGPPTEGVGVETYAIDPRLSEHLNPRPSQTVHLGTTIGTGVPS